MTTLSDEIELLGKLRTYQYKLIKTRRIIENALNIDVSWSVSFSGGKDSTVLLHLLLDYAPDIDIVWFDDGWDYPETREYLHATDMRLKNNFLSVAIPVTASFWKKEIEYTYDDPAYPHNCDMSYDEWKERYIGAFIGMRREESTARFFALRKEPLYYQNEIGHWHCSPLAEWKWQDIWSYIADKCLPYNRVYDKLYNLGVPLSESRVGPLTAWMIWQYGGLAYVKRGWPELYNRFITAHPGARSYA